MAQGAPGASGWISLILMGVFQLGLAYVLYSMAIKHITALEAVLIPVIEPILNPVWVFVLLGEIPGPRAIAGGAIILAAVTGRSVLSIVRSGSQAEPHQ